MSLRKSKKIVMSPLTHKIFRQQKLSKNTEKLPSILLVLSDNEILTKICDTPVFHSFMLPEMFRNTIFLTKMFFDIFLWHASLWLTKVFSPDKRAESESSGGTRNFQKCQKCWLTSFSVLWYCETKNLRQYLARPSRGLPNLQRWTDEQHQLWPVLSLF